MRGTVILIPSIDEQLAAGETDVINPSGVTAMPGKAPLFWDNDYQPENVVGTVDNVRVEDGRLVADIEVNLWEMSYAGVIKQGRETLEGGRQYKLIEELDLMSCGMVAIPRQRRQYGPRPVRQPPKPITRQLTGG